MDITYLLWLQGLRTATNNGFDSFFLFITKFGENAVLVLVGALFYWCINKKVGTTIWLSLAFGEVLNKLFKATACVYRPWIRDPRVLPVPEAQITATGYSFPSGHTTRATAVWCSLAAGYPKNKLFVFICLSITLLVGFSRNYLGVHTPQDVLMALVPTYFIVLGTKWLLEWVEKEKNRDSKVLMGCSFAIALMLIYSWCKPYPLDYVNGVLLVAPKKMIVGNFKGAGLALGILCGWFCERRWIKFTVPATYCGKALVFVGGILLLGAVAESKFFFKMVIGSKFLRELSYNFVVGFYVLAVYPWLWSKVLKLKEKGL